MNIESEKINIDDLFDPKYFHKEVKKGLFLSDYQISILNSNGIKESMYSSMSELMVLIEDALQDDDNEELDEISKEISEFNYYNNINK